MTYMEFLRALVEAETEDERMELVKESGEMFQPSEGEAEPSEEMTAQLEELTAALDDANAQITNLKQEITNLKQEIKDRFFGTYEEDQPADEITEPEDVENEEEKEMTLKDLGFGSKDY